MLCISKLKPYLSEIYKKAYKQNQKGGCTIRSQILYAIANKLGYEAKLMRYFVKGKKEKLILSNGTKFPSHVVLQIENKILNSNTGKILEKEKYEKKLLKRNKREDIEGIHYKEEERIDFDLIKQYCDRFRLKKCLKVLNL